MGGMGVSVPFTAAIKSEGKSESVLPQISALRDKFSGGEIVMDATPVKHYGPIADRIEEG
jgi:hypothetical protein